MKLVLTLSESEQYCQAKWQANFLTIRRTHHCTPTYLPACSVLPRGFCGQANLVSSGSNAALCRFLLPALLLLPGSQLQQVRGVT